MSRIGRSPITVPSNVTVTINGDNVQLRVSQPECVLEVRSLPGPKQQGDVLTLASFRQ